MPKRRRTEWPPPPPPGDGEVALRTLDERAPERAAAYRRRHKHPDEMCGHGNREGSWRTLERINKYVTPCGCCGTLCAWTNVLIAAGRAAGASISPRHGCAAPSCSQSRWHQPPRHAGARPQERAHKPRFERECSRRHLRISHPPKRRIRNSVF